MLEFIKMFGMGIFYTIISPLILAFFLVFVVYSVFNYLVSEIIYLGGFFLGRRYDDTTKLEKQLERMKSEKEKKEDDSSPIMNKEEEIQVQIETGRDGDINE